MTDALNSSQLTTLCVVFVAFHLLALPAFYWAMRHKQFSGAEQRAWSLNDADWQPPMEKSAPANAHKVRLMMAVLLTFAVMMFSSIVLTMIVALHAPSHPIAASGKCPF